MVVCTYFQQGRCKFGGMFSRVQIKQGANHASDRCKFEHPGRQTTGSSGNRFGALSTPFAGIYGVNANDIKLDLTVGKGRPEWVLSSYSPQRHVPRQLFGGQPREQSMEEMRLRHYELAAAGNMNQAIQEAQALYEEATKQMDVALNDLNGAVKYIIDGGNEHPNRIDITEGKKGPDSAPAASAPPASAFGQPSSAFGQPSNLGATSTWGKPTPAQPSQPAQPSAFGQPSTMGQQPGFGQPSTFGQPSGLNQGSAFGQPSTLGGQGGAFGQPAFGQPAFGQPSAPAPTPFGGAPSTASPFNQVPQNQPAAGGFGQPAGQPAPSPFGQPAAPSAFGQPSASGGFGQPSQAASPFSQIQQPQQQPPNPFGQPSGTTGFGAPTQQPAAPAPFGQPAAPKGVPAPPVDTGPRAYIKIDDPNQLNPLPQLEGETLRDPATNRLTMWKGRPVKYIHDHPCYLHPQGDNHWTRVNFPDGPPDEASLRDSQGRPEDYTPEVVAQYEFFLANGYFKDGIMPTMPPKREWISFGF
ncbi:hypothetical protein N7474_005667 [Penicillium riverlandense]|uniref:uncharacterized protein n=1 Tax=Penicillium riverlandense TaxID=1903569 RepID=UPI0025472114|nr:uncharacterized protein N7474_005667 [Penicillium riverlandense]KAJ5820076.1 hypothetical protein N7474_005667 [Penicillium riverlandense]